MVVRKEIVYPYFLECLPYCKGVFWETIFEDLSYGKPPSGSYISKHFLCCSYKNKEFSYKIQRKDPEVLYNEVYALLTDKLGIMSQKEKIKKRVAFNELELQIKSNRHDWSSIKKKNIKDALYERYVIDMKNKHNLSIKKCRYLLAVILVSIMFKSITSKDIEFCDDKIQSISCIDFKDGEIILKKPLCSFVDSVKGNEPEDTTISKNWEGFLKNLKLKAKGRTL